MIPFRNRSAAGKLLGEALHPLRDLEDVVVLALPRGGVPVAYEVASALSAPLDVIVVRKVRHPDQHQRALGALAGRGEGVFEHREEQADPVSKQAFDAGRLKEMEELERLVTSYQSKRGRVSLEEKLVIIVDDGIATGATMLAALRAVRREGPRGVVVAVPVAAGESLDIIDACADQVTCLHRPKHFVAVSQFYIDYSQIPDVEVRRLLDSARRSYHAAHHQPSSS
ncbi:phosphoribosyltransferase family protein [Phycisphaeraceae bacterium D3-23]